MHIHFTAKTLRIGRLSVYAFNIPVVEDEDFSAAQWISGMVVIFCIPAFNQEICH